MTTKPDYAAGNEPGVRILVMQEEIAALGTENDRLRAALNEILCARSVGYAYHLAREALGRDKCRNV